MGKDSTRLLPIVMTEALQLEMAATTIVQSKLDGHAVEDRQQLQILALRYEEMESGSIL